MYCCRDFLTLDLRTRVLSIRDEDSGAKMSCIKSPLPTPKFYAQPLSSKKVRQMLFLRLHAKSCVLVIILISYMEYYALSISTHFARIIISHLFINCMLLHRFRSIVFCKLFNLYMPNKLILSL